MISWMPKYFHFLGVELKDVGWYSVIPYFAMWLTSNVGGLTATELQKGGMSLTTIRKIFQSAAFLVPASSFTVLLLFPGKASSLICVTIAMCGVALSHSGFWVNVIDISPKYAGLY